MAQSTCSVDACDRDVLCRGWCSLHYRRWVATGTTDKSVRPPALCSIEGCGRRHAARGWCRLHYNRFLHHGDTALRDRRRCDVQGCERPHASRGWCDLHYKRWRANGDPMKAGGNALSLEQRLWMKIDQSDPDGCWPWTGTRSEGGYGVIKSDRRFLQTHRVAFWVVHGFYPPVVCHSCDNPPCCRPDHLFGGTQGDNNWDMLLKGRNSKPPNRWLLAKAGR